MGPIVHGNPLTDAASAFVAAGDPRGELARRLGHAFAAPGLLDEALTHRSAAAPALRRGRGVSGRVRAPSNERLEFIGDRVLGLVVAEWLLERFPGEPEGALGRRLAPLVSREALAEIAEAIGLASAIVVSADAARTGVGALANVNADALEAVLGAMFLDGGLDPVRRFVRAEWACLLDGQLAPPKDPKTALQERLAARGAAAPIYRVVREDGPSHAPQFAIEVEAEGRVGRGEAGSKREAERAAASAVLALLPARRRR